jgi:hypothetical protein
VPTSTSVYDPISVMYDLYCYHAVDMTLYDVACQWGPSTTRWRAARRGGGTRRCGPLVPPARVAAMTMGVTTTTSCDERVRRSLRRGVRAPRSSATA